MITIITGMPGHGKTIRMMKMMVEQRAINDDPEKVKLHRHIVAVGIDGLQPGIADEVRDDPLAWQDLPPKSLVFVDEAWKWFGHLHEARGKPTPPEVLAFAEHRHKGLDFVFTSQGPSQMYPFLRPLMGPHEHVVRKFGTSFVEVYKWEELCEEVKSQASRDRAVKETGRLPLAVKDTYKSAEAHTMRARIPWKVWLIPAAILVAVPLFIFAFQKVRPDAMAATLNGGEPASLLADSPHATGRHKDEPMSADEYVERITPRIPGWHGSQPIFDSREAQSQPATLCVMSGEGGSTRCHCYTEQVTPLNDVRDDVCRTNARYGIYDPFRAPPEAASRLGATDQPPGRPSDKDADLAGLSGSSADPAQVGPPNAAMSRVGVPSKLAGDASPR